MDSSSNQFQIEALQDFLAQLRVRLAQERLGLEALMERIRRSHNILREEQLR